MILGNIFIIGPMGSGKSTIGRQLAKALKRNFFDSDNEIEKRTGVSISRIFEMEGEAGFRARERKIISELTSLKKIILATGGGSILVKENRQALKSQGDVVYLTASHKQLLKRTAQNKMRPLLRTEDPQQQIIKLLRQRDVLYRSITDVILQTGNQSIQHTVSNVIKQLKKLRR
ncbi:MAG: shikimate kinase AroK [Piscirickettsiaceae bacterium]|nr:shikimate kinase AroK [Piscirickettsiaceae bacterium]